LEEDERIYRRLIGKIFTEEVRLAPAKFGASPVLGHVIGYPLLLFTDINNIFLAMLLALMNTTIVDWI